MHRFYHRSFLLRYKEPLRLFGLEEVLRVTEPDQHWDRDRFEVAPAFKEWACWYADLYLRDTRTKKSIYRGYNYMKKPNTVNGHAEQGKSLRDESFSKKYPLITEYLTAVKYDDGSSRETSTLSVYVQDGGFGVSINDRDCQRSLYVVATTLSEALAAIEKHLGKEDSDWRSWKPRKGKYTRS